MEFCGAENCDTSKWDDYGSLAKLRNVQCLVSRGVDVDVDYEAVGCLCLHVLLWACLFAPCP